MNNEQLEVTVTKSSHVKTFLMYFKTEAANILRQYDRNELLFRSEVGDNDEIAIAVLPQTSDLKGTMLRERKDGRIVTHCPKDIFDIGTYVMSDTPVFEDDMDWYVLTRKTN